MIARHEALAGMVAQIGPFAADGFRDEMAGPIDLEYRRVELDKLKVGQSSPSPPGQGQAVSSSPSRVGGVCPKAARTATGQHCLARFNNKGLPVLIKGLQTIAASLVNEQGADRRVGIDGDVGTSLEGGQQGPLDFGPRGVAAGVKNAPPAMSRFLTQKQTVGSHSLSALARCRPIKMDAQLDEPAHGCRRFFDKEAYGLRVTEASPRRQGVRVMKCGTVVRPQCRR